MKRVFSITAVILLLITALTVVGCSSGGNTPEETESPMDILKDVLDKTAADRGKGEVETESVWEKVEASGSVGMDFTLPAGFPIKTITSKQYYGSTAATFYHLTNTKGDLLDFTTWSENDKFVLSASPWDQCYGVTYDDIDVLLGYFQGVNSTLDLAKLSRYAEDLEDAFFGLSDEMEIIFSQYAVITPTMTDDGLQVKLTVSGENAPLFVKAIYDMLENDVAFYTAVDGIFIALGSNADRFFNDSEINTFCENLKKDPIAITATLTCNNARVMRKAVITVTDEEITTDAEGNATVTYGEERLNFTLTLGQNGDYGFELYTDDEEYSFDYDVTDSETRRKVAVTVGTSTVKLTPVTYTYNKQDGSFRVNVAIPSSLDAEFSGSYTENETSATLTIDKITYTTYTGGSVIPGLSIGIPMELAAKLLIKADLTATAPSTPSQYTEFSDLTEEEILALAEALKNDPVIADVTAFVELLFQFTNPENKEESDNDIDFGFDFDFGDIFA